MSQQFFLVERGGVVYALPSELVTGVERFTSSLVRLDLALGTSLEVERISMPIEAPTEAARRLSPGAERALPGALGALRLPQGLVLAVEPAFFTPPVLSKRPPRLENVEAWGATRADGDAMLLRLAGSSARLLLPAAQVLEVIPHPEVMRLEESRHGLVALLEWQGRAVPVYGFTDEAPARVALVRGTSSPEVCAIMIEERVERTRWPLKNLHGAVPDFAPPVPVRGAFGYEGQPLLIPDVDLLAA
ncbi:MAG: chemotaxis protein CheW [Bryobacteraceae bacterium]|nr:chemotaxis protein CheW [Bryobacteraceae bacterium]